MSRRSLKATVLAVIACASLFASAKPSVAAEPMRVGETFPIRVDSRGPSDIPVGETESGTQYTLHHPGATYIAVHFEKFDLALGDQVVISDAEGGQVYVLTGKGKMDAGTFWAQHVKGDAAVIQYQNTAEKLGKGFRIDEYAAGFVDMGQPTDTEAICGTNDLKNAVCYQSSHPTQYGKSRAVAKLLIQGASLCTGWLASANNHLITNEHCITSALAALNTDYEFGAEAPNCSSSNCQLCFPGTIFSGATFIRDNVNLDYCLVQIGTGNPAATFGFLQIDNRDAVVGEQIYIPQHPSGRAKELGIESTATGDGGVCRVSSVTQPPCSGSGFNDVGYLCDTEGGSSGSPVLAVSSHKVVALHHCANCPNRAVPIDLICAEICSTLQGCTTDLDCNDGNACTTDVCSAGACSNTPITSCSGGDGCCPSGCTSSNDSDCPSCLPAGTPCSANGQCCSNKCRGRGGNRACR